MDQLISNSKERVFKAIECSSPDRIPIALRIEYAAASWIGLKYSEFALNPTKASEALESAYRRIGGWDIVDASWTLGTRWSRLEAAEVQIPGINSREQYPHRVIDSSIMFSEDYHKIINDGIQKTVSTLMKRLNKVYTPVIEKDIFKSFTHIYKHWGDIGAIVYRGGMVRLPFVQFSMWRTWKGIAQDLLRRRELLKEVCETSWKDFVDIGKKQSKIVGCNFVFIPCGRVSSTFISEKIFLEFVYPYLKMTTEELVRDGFTPRIHCHGEWAPFLKYLLDLPKRKCVLELSHQTDIKLAKEILGGHMCLYGNVPDILLYSGTPRKIEHYCRKLLKDVGKDGFILANDDIVPHNAVFENVKSLVEIGKKFG